MWHQVPVYLVYHIYTHLVRSLKRATVETLRTAGYECVVAVFLFGKESNPRGTRSVGCGLVEKKSAPRYRIGVL